MSTEVVELQHEGYHDRPISDQLIIRSLNGSVTTNFHEVQPLLHTSIFLTIYYLTGLYT
jgi:hypothetical protein